MQQVGKIFRKKPGKKMVWLPVLPQLEEGADPDLREFMGGVEDDIRAMVGKHYYFIRVGAEGPSLCRVPLFTGGKFPREVLDHASHGISDDDLYDALGLKEGNHSVPGYYKISDHIEGKLRSLLET